MNKLLSLSAIVLCACTSEGTIQPEGTWVGNPSRVASSVAPSQDTTLTTGSWRVSEVAFYDNRGNRRVMTLREPADILAGEVIDIPPGTWWAIALLSDDAMTLEGSTAAGGVVDLELEVSEITLDLDTAFVLDPGAHVLEVAFPGWLDPDFTEVTPGRDLLASPGDSLHDRLVRAARFTSALFVDQDDSGTVSETERASGSEVEGRERESQTRQRP